MEFLVTMTTHVPERTSEEAIGDVRAREAVHSRELAAEGRLLRLWRPPLLAGEWRTLGLFDAANPTDLEHVLLSMPLRVWRTDAIEPLLAHPNDPGRQTDGPGPSAALGAEQEFLTTSSLTVPADTPGGSLDAIRAGEADRLHELATNGQLRRLWTIAGEDRTLGLWRAHDGDEMHAVLAALPESVWMSIETIPLSPHPSDPALADPS